MTGPCVADDSSTICSTDLPSAVVTSMLKWVRRSVSTGCATWLKAAAYKRKWDKYDREGGDMPDRKRVGVGLLGAAVMIADEWGEIYFAVDAGAGHELPAPEEITEVFVALAEAGWQKNGELIQAREFCGIGR
mgnify:CR=1 FL=1